MDKKKGEVALSKKDMEKLLAQMGISMKPVELRTLIDAFDADGDGVITMSEFLDFTGPKRDKKGGTMALIMSQKCSWVTTCPVTGMANAFSVSEMTKRARRAAMAEEKSGGGGGGDGGAKDDDASVISALGKVSGSLVRSCECQYMCVVC